MNHSKPETDRLLDLPEFLELVRRDLDVRDEASALSMGPALAALANNNRFLAQYLANALKDPATFQEGNGYVGPVLVLASGPGYMVRALGWPPADAESRTPSNLGVHAYDGDAQVAHSHNFSLLTCGYAGTGYETDVYAWDADDHPIPQPGESVSMTHVGRYQLTPGTTMFYRAFHDAHVQYQPARYSISLNLVILPPQDEHRDQHYFDVHEHRIVTPAGVGNDRRVQLIQLAQELGDPAAAPHLSAIATAHPAARVREAAHRALEVLEGG